MAPYAAQLAHPPSVDRDPFYHSVCAIGQNSEGYVTGHCKGDSGGPLVCASGGGDTYILHGVVSWVRGCGSNWPSVWTSVNYVRDWIDRTMGTAVQLKSVGTAPPIVGG